MEIYGGESIQLSNNINSYIITKKIHSIIIVTLIITSLIIFNINTTKAAPTVIIENPTPNSIIYDKTPTIKIIYYDLKGIKNGSVLLELNNYNITSNANITQESIIYTPKTELSPGTHSIFLSIIDNFNNNITKNWIFTIAETTTTIEQETNEINPGEIKEIIIQDEATNQIGIDKIYIDANKKLEKTNLFIAKISTTSKNINQPQITDTSTIIKGAGYTNINTKTLNVYTYLDIQLTSNDSRIKETDINTIAIRFKIEKIWININNIDKQTVKILKYKEDAWEELTTTYSNEDSNYTYYNTLTEGFSIFAVIGTEKTVEKPSEGINILLIIGIIIGIIIITLVILFKTGIIYIEEE